MTSLRILLWGLVPLLLTQPVAAGDVEKGKAKAAEVCVACHGLDGVSQNPMYPHIGGQYEDYMLHALRGYKSGERQNAIMQGIVAGLSDEQIEDVAAYYAAQPSVLHSVPRH